MDNVPILGLFPKEDRRKLVHLSMTTFALLLRWLEPWQAVAFAGAAIFLNWVLLPLLGVDRHLGRDGEHYVSGVKLYPVGVLIAVLLFPMPAAAAGWAALGVGDFVSNVLGRRLGRKKLPWNPVKSWAGLVAFIVFGLPASAFLLWFTWDNWTSLGGDPGAHAPFGSAGRIWMTAAASVSIAAVLETIPIPRLNDNLSVPVGAALVAWLVASGF